MKHPISNLLDYCTSHDWAMRLSVMESMSGIIERHVKGQHLTEAEINAITAETHAACPDHRRRRAVFASNPSMAVIDISGVIAKHADMVNDISQPRGTSIETLRDEFSKAMADDKIGSIFLNIESPGGSIDGLADFASEIFEASFRKPIVAFADDLCASAAYWMASQANIVYASQTSDIGSIGVYTLYVDSTERAKTEGLKFHIFRSGIHKGIGSAGIEITEENQEAIQERIDAKFEIFFDAIMRGRAEAGLTENELREIADGRCFVGQAALDNKLIDAIMTIPQAMAASLPAVRNKNEAAVASAEKNDSNLFKEPIMAKNTEQVDASVETQKSDAVAAERTRIQAITSTLAGDEFAELREKAITEGWTLEKAKVEAFEVSKRIHAEQLKASNARAEEAQKKLDAIQAGSDTVIAQPTDDAGTAGKSTASGDGDDPNIFLKYRDTLEANGKTPGEAIKAAARRYPDSHQAWVKDMPESTAK